jgi:hypothetical protein
LLKWNCGIGKCGERVEGEKDCHKEVMSVKEEILRDNRIFLLLFIKCYIINI